MARWFGKGHLLPFQEDPCLIAMAEAPDPGSIPTEDILFLHLWALHYCVVHRCPCMQITSTYNKIIKIGIRFRVHTIFSRKKAPVSVSFHIAKIRHSEQSYNGGDLVLV